MIDIDNFFMEQDRKNNEGTLTVGEATFGYYRLLEGNKAGKVIIKTCAKIDGQSVVFFANGLVWSYLDKLKDIKCERVFPTFSQGKHAIDRSEATWYDDNGSTPRGYEW